MAKRRNISGRTLRQASPTNAAAEFVAPRTSTEGLSVANIFGDIGDVIHPGITAKIEDDLGLRDYTDDEIKLLMALGMLPFAGKIAKAGVKGVKALNKASRLPAKGGFIMAYPANDPKRLTAKGLHNIDTKRTRELNKILKPELDAAKKKLDDAEYKYNLHEWKDDYYEYQKAYEKAKDEYDDLAEMVNYTGQEYVNAERMSAWMDRVNKLSEKHPELKKYWDDILIKEKKPVRQLRNGYYGTMDYTVPTHRRITPEWLNDEMGPVPNQRYTPADYSIDLSNSVKGTPNMQNTQVRVDYRDLPENQKYLEWLDSEDAANAMPWTYKESRDYMRPRVTDSPIDLTFGELEAKLNKPVVDTPDEIANRIMNNRVFDEELRADTRQKLIEAAKISKSDEELKKRIDAIINMSKANQDNLNAINSLE